MIYKIAFSCEEGDNFRLVFEADPDATFLELHEAILSAVKYNNDQMTSFFMCNDRWEKEQEVTLIEMDRNFDYDNMVMDRTHLADLMEEQGSGSSISSTPCSNAISLAHSRKYCLAA